MDVISWEIALLGLAVLAYFLKKEHGRIKSNEEQIKTEVRALEAEFNKFKLEVKEKYADSAEVREVKRELLGMFDKIENKLDDVIKMVTDNTVNIAKHKGGRGYGR